MKILLVDDDDVGRQAAAEFLEEQLCCEVTQCGDAQAALDAFTTETFPMVVMDIRMPGLNGIELLQKLKELPNTQCSEVVILTGYGDLSSAIQALRSGAFDYLMKPVNVEELADVVTRIEKRHALLEKTPALKRTIPGMTATEPSIARSDFLHAQGGYMEIEGVGRLGLFCDEMRNVAAIAERLHEERLVPVLIEGETGTGKEVVARLIHYGCNTPTTPFVSINCPAISPTLFESELFGYEGGAFTGAKACGMIGKFEAAQGGTLFLDEIGDTPFELQPKLLRAIEAREIYRVGGVEKIPLDVRIICSTNRNLRQLVDRGLFRNDLYFRLSAVRIFIPPLRQMREAIAPLAQMFLEQIAEKKKRRFKLIQKEAVEILEQHPWPGNIRELKNTIERIILLYDNFEISPEHLNFLTSSSDSDRMEDGYLLKPGQILLPRNGFNLKAVEAEIVRKTLAMFHGNKTKAASYLGISRSALRSYIKKVY